MRDGLQAVLSNPHFQTPTTSSPHGLRTIPTSRPCISIIDRRYISGLSPTDLGQLIKPGKGSAKAPVGSCSLGLNPPIISYTNAPRCPLMHENFSQTNLPLPLISKIIKNYIPLHHQYTNPHPQTPRTRKTSQSIRLELLTI